MWWKRNWKFWILHTRKVVSLLCRVTAPLIKATNPKRKAFCSLQSEMRLYERVSPKVTVFSAMSARLVYGLSFFHEKTVTGIAYLDMLQNWLFSQPQDIIWQEDGATPHFLNEVQEWLNDVVVHRWVGRHSLDNTAFFRWSPKTLDLTPCDFFLWGFVKDLV